MRPVHPTAPLSPVRISLAELIALGDQLPACGWASATRLAPHSGHYRSRFRGRGMEFAEVRAYQPGDDVRSIDWRVTARRGKVHTKLFHEERERPLLLALDYRRPMFFATRGCFKAVQASRLAALCAWQALARGDRVGGFLFSELATCELRPQRGKAAVLRLLRQMVQQPVWERPLHQPFAPQQRLAETLGQLRAVARPGSLILLLSDFSQWDQRVEKELTLLGRHAELGLVHCYDALETELPPAGSYRLSDGEGDLSIATAAAADRQRYRQEFAGRRRALEDLCRRLHARLLSLPTDGDPRSCLLPVGRRG